MTIKRKQYIDLVLGGLLLVILRLPVLLLGRLLRRDHSLSPRGNILVIKMQGGGSLVIAFPALLGIRKQYSDCRLILLTVPSVAPFAESLGIFDEIIRVEDSDFLSLVFSSFHCWLRTLWTDTVIDLEVYSRLTTVFSVLIMARNRIGFFLESAFWRRYLHTHLIFLNRYSGIYYFYNEIARLLSSPVESRSSCAEHLRKNLVPVSKSSRARISIGHACSEFGKERMLSADQWIEVFRKGKVTSEEIVFLGATTDYLNAQEIIEVARAQFPAVDFQNKCGTMALKEAVAYIDSSDEFWGIDSGLLHYARLLGKKTVSFWGPTDPATRLQCFADVQTEIYYHKVPCSPCIHVAEAPFCEGENICLRSIFQRDEEDADEKKTFCVSDHIPL
jgi:ADP-heptose:LPS heptosyltransferase